MQQSETAPLFVDLNVLPEELRPARYQRLFVTGLMVLLAATLLLLPLYQSERAAGDETARLRAELDMISLDLTFAQLDLGNVRDLQRQLAAAETELAGLNEERQVILAAGQELSRELSAAVAGLPDGARLVSVSGDDDQMTLTGGALSVGDVFRFANTIEASQGFSEARVTSLVTEGGEVGDAAVTFTIEAVR